MKKRFFAKEEQFFNSTAYNRIILSKFAKRQDCMDISGKNILRNLHDLYRQLKF